MVYVLRLLNKLVVRKSFTSVTNVDSLDWKDLPVEEITNRVVGKVKNGSIILFHNGAKNTPEALKVILPKLAEKGYKFVSVSELIYKDNYKIDVHGRQSQVSNGG